MESKKSEPKEVESRMVVARGWGWGGGGGKWRDVGPRVQISSYRINVMGI